MPTTFDKSRHDLQLLRLRNTLPRLFGEVDEAMFQTILPHLEWVELPGGKRLFNEGDEGQSLYILISGRLMALALGIGGEQRPLGEITRGETVGEMAIFTGEKRSASVVAMRDCVLARITKESFEEIIHEYPTVMMNITKLIIERLKQRNSTERLPTKLINIALVPISPGVQMEDFAQQVFQKMTPHGHTLLLSNRLVEEALSDDDIAEASPREIFEYRRLSAWLDEQEALHDYLIYQADPTSTEWTRRCLRQADEIILVGNVDEPIGLSLVEQELLQGDTKITTARQVLVLLHGRRIPDITQHVQAWLDIRGTQFHHHLVKNNEADFERLARFMTGKAIGLVLAGGGAKGLAHIGVFKALEEKGIPIDMVGGTSIGSIVAGMIAAGWSFRVVHDICRSAFLENPTPPGDYNVLPIVSFLKGKRLDRLLHHVYGDKSIENLWLNFFCVSTSLIRATSKIHRQGMMKKAIRASISLPGIFPPVVDGTDLLIDGGIVNNLPVDVMIELGAGRIVAVDFDMEQSYIPNFETAPSPWEILKMRFSNQKQYNIPSLMTTLVQSTTLNSTYKTRLLRQNADLVFNPDLSAFGLMEWKSFDRIVEVGYRHALEVLEKWEGWKDEK